MTVQDLPYGAPERSPSSPDLILLVDDDPRMRAGVRALISTPGRTILESSDGADAIAVLQVSDVLLVLLDINLPGISGLDVMEWIALNRSTTGVIMVSGDSHIESAIRALRNGAMDFIRKPQDMELLPHKVDSALQQCRLERSHRLMTARLEQSERLHRFLVENSPDLIYTLDPEGRFLFINKRVETLLGYKRDELLGKPYRTIVHEDDQEKALYAFTERRSDERATSNIEIRLKCKSQQYRRVESHAIVAMLSATGIYDNRHDQATQESSLRYKGTYGVARDVTERKIAEETISFQALHDHLTLLPNRRLFKDRLELAITQATRYGGCVGVMFLDLDRFKLVNDTHGHAEGDELLKNVATRLAACIRASDTLARQGGDEFTILLPDLKDPQGAAVIAEKILDELKQPFLVAGNDFRATASIGISIFPTDDTSAEALLKHADIAMYKVKSSGKNGFKFFNRDMVSSYHERMTLENELRSAIRNGEFELYYQPQIHVTENRIVGLEALVRWRHPVHGLLNPSGFIDMAEEIGLISSVTDWVIGEACRSLARWHSLGHNDLRMAINISPQEFISSDLVERITSGVTGSGVAENMVDMEITENVLMNDVSGIAEKIRQLRDRGICISIDDFGTRYSSLNYLRRFPVSTIKIDKTFVRDLAETHNASPIIQAIIGIARGFGLQLLAEGVETIYQMKTLQELGCNVMQGYFFSKPLPSGEIEQFLNNFSKSAGYTSETETTAHAPMPAHVSLN